MTNFILIRLGNQREGDILRFTEIATKYAFAFEVGTKNKKPHTHILLETTKDLSQVRGIAKSLNLHGNGDYSSKYVYIRESEADRETEVEPPGIPIEPLAYLMKGDNKPVINGIDQYDIDRAQILSESYDVDKKRPMVEKIQKWILEHNGNVLPNRTVLIQRIIEYHLEKGLLIRSSMIECYYHSISCKNDEYYVRDFAKYLFEKTQK